MNVTDDIVARLRGTLPADGTLVTEYDRLCAHAAAVIEMLREDKATLRDILGMVKDERDARLTAEADADRLAASLADTWPGLVNGEYKDIALVRLELRGRRS